MNWQTLQASWKSLIATHPDTATVPATLATPDQPWAYGAFTDLIETDRPATIRVKAKALKGKIGLCLITEDYSGMASKAFFITPDDKDAVVEIAFAAEKSPARLLVRNHGDPGAGGEVTLQSVDIAFLD